MSDLDIIRIDTHSAAIRASLYEQAQRDAGNGIPAGDLRIRRPDTKTQVAHYGHKP
jgi:hypothetical protein